MPRPSEQNEAPKHVSETHPQVALPEEAKSAFHIQPGSEVYVRRSDKTIDGRWIYDGEDADGMKVHKIDKEGGKHVRHMTSQELEDLNRPTTLEDIRGMGQKSIDDLLHVIRMLREGGITDANGFIPSEDQAQMITDAYHGEIPLRKITSAGYLKPVLEHIMRLDQVGQVEAAKPFETAEDRSVEPAHKMPGQGDWVRVKGKDGQFERNWVMMRPDENTGTVMLTQIVNNLPWKVKTVSLDELKEWNS